jgi:hypothetical protein
LYIVEKRMMHRKAMMKRTREASKAQIFPRGKESFVGVTDAPLPR